MAHQPDRLDCRIARPARAAVFFIGDSETWFEFVGLDRRRPTSNAGSEGTGEWRAGRLLLEA
jgi:hypothetical protein